MRERAVRMVRETMAETPRLSQKRAYIEVGEQLGIKGDTLRNWVKIVRVDDGELPGTTSADAKRIAELERRTVS